MPEKTGDSARDAPMSEDVARTLRRPPNRVSVHQGMQHDVILPEVFRYEDSRWIDEFFNEGKLRLSSFAKFAKYDDEQRGDPKEGSGLSLGHGGGKTVGIAHSQGQDAYVFCGSLIPNHDIRCAMKRDSAFAIQDPLSFAVEIARQLPGFRGSMQGNCIYRPNTIINREFSVDIEKYKLPDGTIDMQMIFDAGAALGGPERLLLKTKRYELQREYRFLWFVDKVRGEHLDIECPNAVQYCRRVELSELEPE